MTDATPPVRYVLFSHYGYGEDGDFKKYRTRGSPETFEGVKHLFGHFRGLKELLTTPGHEGLLVLFYSPGYARFLEGLAQREDDKILLEENPSTDDKSEMRGRLQFAATVANCVNARLRAENLAGRVRFLTSFDLRPVLGLVNTIFAEKFKRFFLGSAQGIRYDSPKVVEAILRLRVLGNGVPVLRIDHDVLFRGAENQGIEDLGLFKAVACAVRAYRLRLEEPSVSTFLFSASYDSRALRDPAVSKDRFGAWSRAFATRVYPALRLDNDGITISQMKEKKDRDEQWKEYVNANVDEALCKRFYGLKDNLEVDGYSGLTSIGAHPAHAVISGALLCLSEGAILDLPPFSNFSMNVMWIDDHLKYSLHRALNHFTSGETLNLEPGLSDARLDEVAVTKARPAVEDLPAYVFGMYLPSLLWGSIMDAWITSDPILKCRIAGCRDDGERNRWREARETQDQAPLPEAMLKALRIGRFDPISEDQLKERLKEIAVSRIETVRQLWASLRDEGTKTETFASLWASGRVAEVLGNSPFTKYKDHLWQGIAPGRDIKNPVTAIEDLPNMEQKVNDLVADTLRYVHWTLEWPTFVQIVRSIRQGSFKGDLRWGFFMAEVDGSTWMTLKRFRFDPEVLKTVRRTLLMSGLQSNAACLTGRVDSPQPRELVELPRRLSDRGKELANLGQAALKRGEVGIVVLAGGMATRLQGAVKAAVGVEPGQSLLSLMLANIQSTAAAAGAVVRVFLLTSLATSDEIQRLISGRACPETPIEILEQSVTMRLTSSGEILRDAQGRPSLCATGHGDLLPTLRASGAIKRFRQAGGRILMVANVDNPMASLDPLVIGAHCRGGKDATVEVVRKKPGDRGGIPVRIDGRLQIVEEFCLPEGFNSNAVPFFNTNTFVFDASAIDREFDLEWFIVSRKVDDQEAIQAERLLGQVTAFLSTQFLIVERDGPDGRFFPVKDSEDLRKLRALLETKNSGGVR